MMNLLFRSLFPLAMCLFISVTLFCQVQDTSHSAGSGDTMKNSFVNRMQAFAQASAKSSAEDFAADKAVIEQNRIFEEIKKGIQKTKMYLRTGVDTLNTKAQLEMVELDYAVAGDGVLTNKGTAQTFRNLTATSKILYELLNKVSIRKARLDIHQQNLYSFRYQADSLMSLPALFKFPKDSVTLTKYIKQISVLAYELHPMDSTLREASIHVQELLNRVNMLAFRLQTSIEEIELYQRDIANNSFGREFENIWHSSGAYRPFGEIVAQAWAKGKLTLVFYLQGNIGKVILLTLLLITCYIYLRSLKKIYQEQQLLIDSFEGQLVLRYPLFSAPVIIINLFQFIFFSPPFILSVILWSIAAISLAVMFKNFISSYWMKVWLTMVVLFLVTAFDNLILQASRSERWFMLVVAFAGSVIGLLVLIKGKKEELRERLILVAIALMVGLELGSALANVAGRYNLSKSLLISGYLNVVIAILFLWTIRLINEGLFLAFNVYTRQESKLFFLNFDKVGKKVPAFLYLAMIFGWIILFGRNFAGFEYIAGPLRTFFSTERAIGDYTFSINKLLLFIIIMSVSVIISKVVSFFASDKHLHHDKEDKQTRGIGSWLLLIRICILTIGLFLAIAAAGIPLDRITIVLGALGVGIGFGLQTLVNNLVSGLIIAFEKPVNVGDVVDIDGQAGTIKSIGFRSSVIATWDGADVVMPNGDLLNSHLTNWSLGGNRRRLSLVIGIAYDADLNKTKTLLKDILDAEDRLLKYPAPVVQYEQFGESSIDVRIYFWTKHIFDPFVTKSDLIITINDAFKANGIVIPFPQREVFLHSTGKDVSREDGAQS